MVFRAVEPQQHRRIGFDRREQLAEFSPRVAAKQFVLGHHRFDPVDAVQGRGEMIVPDERQPFAQRVGAKRHAVQPPGADLRGSSA